MYKKIKNKNYGLEEYYKQNFKAYFYSKVK